MDRNEQLSNWLLNADLEREPVNPLAFLTETSAPQTSAAYHSFSLADLLQTEIPRQEPAVPSQPAPVTPAGLTRAPLIPPHPLRDTQRANHSAQPSAPAVALPSAPPVVPTPTHSSPVKPQAWSSDLVLSSQIFELVDRILAELRESALNLLQLNPTRREAIVLHLERTAGQSSPDSKSAAAPASAKATTFGANDPRLKSWIVGSLSPQQEAALNAYFEELALVCLGQAFLLKSWSDRGLRKWQPDCLSGINWVLTTALKDLVPFGREGWQITSRTIYSWYNPSPALQKEIWYCLENLTIRDDDAPRLLGALLSRARQRHAGLPTAAEFAGYDGRFYALLWSQLKAQGFTAETVDMPGSLQPLRRRKKVFSPSLRDGAMVRTAPANLDWVGLEQNPFLLMVAELSMLWWGPAAPPLWTAGTGLESHSREQMSFALGQSRAPNQLMAPKLTLHSLIGEIESCELAIVGEEPLIRANGRNLEAQRLREQIEEFPTFKRLRAAGTSLGDLQACVAMNKLRPGGQLWWAREEALAEHDGREVLTYLLERGRLLAEWDFSGLKIQGRGLNRTDAPEIKLLPRHLYLWLRDADIQSRHGHRPLRITVQGKIASQEEFSRLLPQLFEEAIRAAVARMNGANPDAIQRPLGALANPPWTIHVQISPSTQKEWAEHWPEPTGADQLMEISRIRQISLPLATISTVRMAQTLLPSNALHVQSDPNQPQLTGVLLRPAGKDEPRKLKADSLVSIRRDLDKKTLSPESISPQGAYHILIPLDEGRIAPLLAWLESPVVRRWIDHHAERKGDRWVLTEQIVKFIPVPRQLLRTLGMVPDPRGGGNIVEAQPNLTLPLDWEKSAADLALRPRAVLDRLRNEIARAQPETVQLISELKSQLFVRAAQIQAHNRLTQSRLMSMVGADGKLRWREVFGILPPSEFSAVAMHSAVRLTGTLPPQIPITRWDRVRVPTQGILLATEAGFHLHLGCESSRMIDMILDQLQGLKHPVWADLAPWLKLPRNLERVEQIGNELLHAWHEQQARMTELQEFMEECGSF